MKKLLILSGESVLSGYVKCGIAEVVDSLALSMVNNYDVCVVCPEGRGAYMQIMADISQYSPGIKTCKLMGVRYYMIEQGQWNNYVIELIDEIAPDVFHNFSAPNIITKLLSRPHRAILTFDSTDLIKQQEAVLCYYDYVTTLSKTYAQAVSTELTNNSRSRSIFNIKGIDTGILTSVISPQKGLFLQSKFSADSLNGRRICEERFRETYGIGHYTCIYGMMCRLIDEKGIDDVLDVAHYIRDTGGILVIVGRGAQKYEQRLAQMTRADGVIWIKKWASPFQAAPFMAGIDFYLSPSKHEVCSLMTMTAAQYGAIPIVTPVNAMGENFNDDNAIMVGNDGLVAAIDKAAALHRNKYNLRNKRKACMTNDFGWDVRKQGYIEVYEQ